MIWLLQCSIQINGIHTIFRPKKQIPSLKKVIWTYIVGTKAFYGLKYLPNIATWIWSFQKHLSFSKYDQKNTLTYQSLHPRILFDTQNWSYSKPFRHLCRWNSCRVRFVGEKIQGTHVELLDLSVVKHHKYRKGLKQWEKSNILSIVLSISESLFPMKLGQEDFFVPSVFLLARGANCSNKPGQLCFY